MVAQERVALAKLVFDYASRNLRVRLRRTVKGARRPSWTPQVETMVDLLRGNVERIRGFGVEELRGQLTGPLVASNAIRAVRCQACDAGGVPAEWVEPREGKVERHILYLHGGGYVVGSPRSHRDLLARLALKARARVLGLDYRLAPEHPFPAAIDDAVAAYRFLIGATGGGVSPNRIVVAGESAGGGLTIATMLTLREQGADLPAGAVLLSPWLDLSAAHPSIRENADYDWIDWYFLDRCARYYLGDASAREPRASPIHADLAGLPPILLQVGSAELLFDEGRIFADRARQAGVDTTLEVHDDMFHAWQLFAALLPEARHAIRSIAAFAERCVPA